MAAPANPRPATRSAARHRLPTGLRLLIAARAVNQLGAFSLAFLTVLLNRDLGASLRTAGAVCALFGLATIPSRLLGGRLTDRWGRRRTILVGLLGCALAQLGIAAAPTLAFAAICCVLLGFAFELYEPPSQAMIADAVAPQERASAYALLTTALAVGNMGAGLIADVVGRAGLRWLFVLDAASCLACAAIVRLVLPNDRARAPAASPAPLVPPSAARSDTNSPWRDRPLLTMTALGTVFALVSMLMLVALPLSLSADGVDPAAAGLIMTASTVTLLAARPALRLGPLSGLGPSAAFAAGYVLMAAGLSGYALARTVPALLGPTVLYALGNLLLTGRSFAVVSEFAPPGRSARYLAVYGLSWGIATVLAPPLSSGLLAAFRPPVLWAAMSATSLAMAAVQPLVLRRLPQRRI